MYWAEHTSEEGDFQCNTIVTEGLRFCYMTRRFLQFAVPIGLQELRARKFIDESARPNRLLSFAFGWTVDIQNTGHLCRALKIREHVLGLFLRLEGELKRPAPVKQDYLCDIMQPE